MKIEPREPWERQPCWSAELDPEKPQWKLELRDGSETTTRTVLADATDVSDEEFRSAEFAILLLERFKRELAR